MNVEISILLLFAILIFSGIFFGYFFDKVKLPILTAYIFTGILLGPSLLNLVNDSVYDWFKPFNNFAIALIAIVVGSHLDFSRLHNSYKRILFIAFSESLLSFFTVFAVFFFINPLNVDDNYNLIVSLVVASLSCATSPASTLHVVKDKKAKGIVVKTLIAVIVVDNIVCLALFEFSRAFSRSIISEQNFLYTILFSSLGFICATLIGLISAYVLHKFFKYRENKKKHSSFEISIQTQVFLSIMVIDGIAVFINSLYGDKVYVSALICHLFFGITIANISSRHKDKIVKELHAIEEIIFICFFVVAGSHLDVSKIDSAVMLPAILYLTCLFIGKVFGSYFGGVISYCPKVIRENIGKMLYVQAGITIALLSIINYDPLFVDTKEKIITVILTCTIFTELVGSILLAKGLDKTQQTGKARERVINFLEEEFILPYMYSHDKWHAIEELCHFMYKTHEINISETELINKVIEREKMFPTGMANEIAMPHARIEGEENEKIKGVLAVCDPKIDFGSKDNSLSKYVLLLLVPKNEEYRYQEVKSTIEKLLTREDIKEKMSNTNNSAEMYDILHSEEVEDYNYFL